MSRQPAPQPDQDLSRFPVEVLSKGSEVFRSHRADLGPCFFNGTTNFRFNLPNGRGTCYVGDDVATAVREKLRELVLGQGIVPATLANSFVVSTIRVDRPFRCAAIGDSEAVGYGVSRMLGTMDAYDVPQKWAAAFDSSRFEGIRYGSSYTNGPDNAWALFGEAGERSFGGAVATLTGAGACAVAGIAVYGVPRLDELDIV